MNMHAARTSPWTYSTGIQCGDAAGPFSTNLHGYATRTSSMDMEQRHAVRTSRIDIHNGQAAWTCSNDLHLGHAVWTCRMHMQHGYTAWTCCMNNQHGHAAMTCSMDMQNAYAALIYSMDMLHGHAAWTCGKDLRHGPAAWTCSREKCGMDMQHEHAAKTLRVAWTWSMGIRDEHAEWTCGMDIQYGHAHMYVHINVFSHIHGHICIYMQSERQTASVQYLQRYCSANSNRGQYEAQIIRAGKLEIRPFFFLNFKGTPSQEEHKTIFSSLKTIMMALSGQSDATALFQAIRYTLCDTYIDFPQSVNSRKSIF